jgi:hypothetical protein
MFSPMRPLEQHREVDNASPRSSTTGAWLLARERERLPHQAAARLAFCLICMMSWNDGSVGRRVQQEIGRHDGAQQIVEVVRDVAGEPALVSIFCC